MAYETISDGENRMDRREILVGGGALAALLLSQAGRGDEHVHDGPDHSHHVHGARRFAALAGAAADCVKTGQVCIDHCLDMFAQGDNATAACARSVNQLLPVCTALQQLAAQNSPYVQRYASLAREICRDCERECRKHEKEHQACRDCAESCAACAKECDAVAA
jgi:Cys-rich four helix bundle protein (predicted Tat secretion target)